MLHLMIARIIERDLSPATPRSMTLQPTWKWEPFMRTLTIWEGDAYDAAGDYTQAQAEARILEVLGPDIKAGLERLFVR